MLDESFAVDQKGSGFLEKRRESTTAQIDDDGGQDQTD